MKWVFVIVTLAALVTPPSTQADVYTVDQSFSNGGSNATLTGTVDIPEGSYTIIKQGASPFTAVNLTLTVNGTPFNLNEATTGYILGTGQFFVDATPTTLTFNTANANATDPADLAFFNSDPSSNYRYTVGYDGAPGFEAAITGVGTFGVPLALPVVFGNATVVPEPANIAGAFFLLTFGLQGIRHLRNRK